MLQEDGRVTYHKIKETIDLNAQAMRSIPKDHFFWVPHILNESQKTQHVKWGLKTLKMFDKGMYRYKNNIVTVDETWQYYYDVSTKF